MLSLANCPSTKIQGTNEQITIAPSGGTLPYTKLELLEDNVVIKTLDGSFRTPQIINYNFPVLGIHTYSSRATDSCIPPKIVMDSVPCSINVVQNISTTGLCGTQQCDLSINYCLFDKCIPKNYVLYGLVGIVALLLLSKGRN